MSTITKLNYLADTKDEIKDALNSKFNAGITDNDTFRSYVDKIKGIYNNWPKVTGEGTEITLTPTRKGRVQLDLKGNTSQASLPTGYTALDYIESTGTQYIDTGRFSTPNTKFEMDYLSNKEEGETFQCLFGSQNGVNNRRAYMLLGTSNIVTIHFPYSSGNHVLYMRTDGTFSGGALADTVTVNKDEKNKIIFDIPNKSVSVGQYTSVSTSTDTLLDSSHSILIFARNDNSAPTSNFAIGKLYNFKWYENNKIVMDLIPCKNSNNEIGLYDVIGGTFFGNAGTGDFVAGNEITIPSPDYPQDIHVVTGNNTISIGNTDYPINLGNIELCKIEDYQDYLYKENGNWYEYKAIIKRTINNITNWAIQSNSKQREKTRVFEHNFVDKAVGRVLSNNFKNKGVVLTTTDDEEYIGDGAGYNQRVYISIKKDRLVGYDDSMTDSQANQLFQTWLSNSDTSLAYIRITPTITQITDETLISQLDAIENAMSTTGTTTITQTNADLPFIINASALKKGGN